MKVQAVSNQETKKTSKIGKNVGTIAGFAGYVGNVAIKEGKDVFKKAAEEAVQYGVNPKAGVALKVGAIGLIAAGFAIVGRIVGGVIDKLIDKHQAQKQ